MRGPDAQLPTGNKPLTQPGASCAGGRGVACWCLLCRTSQLGDPYLRNTTHRAREHDTPGTERDTRGEGKGQW
jgi:hypothetical protein